MIYTGGNLGGADTYIESPPEDAYYFDDINEIISSPWDVGSKTISTTSNKFSMKNFKVYGRYIFLLGASYNSQGGVVNEGIFVIDYYAKVPTLTFLYTFSSTCNFESFNDGYVYFWNTSQYKDNPVRRISPSGSVTEVLSWIGGYRLSGIAGSSILITTETTKTYFKFVSIGSSPGEIGTFKIIDVPGISFYVSGSIIILKSLNFGVKDYAASIALYGYDSNGNALVTNDLTGSAITQTGELRDGEIPRYRVYDYIWNMIHGCVDQWDWSQNFSSTGAFMPNAVVLSLFYGRGCLNIFAYNAYNTTSYSIYLIKISSSGIPLGYRPVIRAPFAYGNGLFFWAEESSTEVVGEGTIQYYNIKCCRF